MQAAIAETTYIATYSARKKIEKRMPEYSVWNPATSSDSASGRSKGARLFSASDAVKYMMNTSGMTGLRKTSQFHAQPCWSCTVSWIESVPVIAATVRNEMP